MNGKRLIPVLALTLVTQFVFNSGCRPDLPADPEAVLRYLRAARIQGKVYRLWPEGQAYVDRVLKADAVLKRDYADLQTYADANQFWRPGDPRWRDVEAVEKQADALAAVTDTGLVERMTKVRALEDALNQVPDSLKLSGTQAQAFVMQAWAALAVDDLALKDLITHLENLARAQLIVYQTAAPHADSLVIRELRPRFASAELQARFDRSYAAARDALEEGQDRGLRYCEQEMIASTEKIDSVTRAERQYFRDREKHYRDRATRIIRALRNDRSLAEAAEKAAEKKVRRASDDTRSAAEAMLAFAKGEVERLDGRITTIQRRIDDVLARVETIKAKAGGQD